MNLEDSRYRMLETVRQYAREKMIEREEGEQLRARHLDYFLNLAERCEQELHGRGQLEWSQKIEAEYENWRAALEWSLQGNIQAGQRLAAALCWAWDYSGYFSEGIQWLEKMLTASPQDETITRARMLAGAGWLAETRGDEEKTVIDYSQASVDLFRKLGDSAGAAFPLATLARYASFRSDFDQALVLAEESLALFISSGNKWGVGYAVAGLGWSLLARDNIERAQKIYEECLAICEEAGNYRGKSQILFLMAEIVERQGNWGRAVEFYNEALKVGRPVNGKRITCALLNFMGNALLQLGDYVKSQSLFEETLEISRRIGDRRGIASALKNLGFCAYVRGDLSEASSFLCNSLQVTKQMENDFESAVCLHDIGVLWAKQGHLEKFTRMWGVAQGIIPGLIDILTPSSMNDTQEAIENSHTVLGEKAYTDAYEAGRQMTLDEAIAYALKELGQ